MIFRENHSIVKRNGIHAANLHEIPLDEKEGRCMGSGGRKERAYVCRLFGRGRIVGSSREKQVVAGWWGKRDECKADRRRGTKYETNSWNDGEERARERARGKQLDRVASNAEWQGAARRRMLAARRIEREKKMEMGEDRKR